MIGWFEVYTIIGSHTKTDLFQIKEVQENKERRILIKHLMTLPVRTGESQPVSGDELEITGGRLRLLDCGKLIFWLEDRQRLGRIKLFSSKKSYQKSLKISFHFIEWHFDQDI